MVTTDTPRVHIQYINIAIIYIRRPYIICFQFLWDANANSIMYFDPLGLDAIVLNNPFLTASHMSAFVQDENDVWHFFFWGAEVHYREVKDASIMSDINKINEWIRAEGMNEGVPGIGSFDYDSFCYIVGNFTKSHEYFADLKNTYDKDVAKGKTGWFGIQNRNFDLTGGLGFSVFGISGLIFGLTAGGTNCTQMTMAGLYLGILPDENGTTVKDFMKAAGYGSVSVDPGTNLKNLQKAFGNTSHTKSGAYTQIGNQMSKYSILAGNARNDFIRQDYLDIYNNYKKIRAWYK